MKKVKMMYLRSCPHCRNAFAMIEKLKEEHPEYQNVEIETIEENEEEEKTVGFDYWYVPTYFVNDKKVHEGVPTIETIEEVLKQAIS